MKRILTTILFPALLGLTISASAATLQQIQVANMLYNQDATGANPGLSTTSILVKFFTSGASLPCYTATIPFESSVSVTTGTGQACSSAVATVTVTPVASTVVGTIYTAPATTTLSADFTQQLIIQQRLATSSPTTSYGPIFDTTNGIVTTPGTAIVIVQSHLMS